MTVSARTCLAVIDGLAPVTGRIDARLRQYAEAGPRVKTLITLPDVGQFTALVMPAGIGDSPASQRRRQLEGCQDPHARR